jgi:multidrug efflux system outer membrane protein
LETVVDADRNLYSAQLQYVQSQGDLFSAMVSLYKAMGGGWIEQVEQAGTALANPTASAPPAS